MMAKTPKPIEVAPEIAKRIGAAAARYAVADPGKDARDSLFREIAKMLNAKA